MENTPATDAAEPAENAEPVPADATAIASSRETADLTQQRGPGRHANDLSPGHPAGSDAPVSAGEVLSGMVEAVVAN